MQRAGNSHRNVQLNGKLLQFVSIIGFAQSLEIVEDDFENFLHTQKFAMSERAKCETSHIKEELVHQEGLIYSVISKHK